MRETVNIAGKTIGKGCPAYIVVELGVTHEQKVELAERFVERAADSGADCVKVESFQADELVADKSITHTYGTANGEITENYYELLKRLELNDDGFKRIKRKADRVGISFFPTVATKRSIDFFQELDVCAFKLASPDITNYPLQRLAASTGKPIFLDTGGSYLHEIERALFNLGEAGAEEVALMHNPSGYPAPPEKTDLKIIGTLIDVFNIPVGLSCHTPGYDCVMASLALGANVIEKPITRDPAILSPEHVFSFPEADTANFVRRIRRLEKSLGGKRRLEVSENSLPRHIGRRGIYAVRAMKAGDRLREEDLILAKPEKGISVTHLDIVLGRTLRNNVGKHTPITWDDI